MEASSFKEANAIMGPPPGLTEDEVISLSVWRGLSGRHKVVISCWKLTQAELEEVNQTGRVWLYLWGESMPPACVMGLTPAFPPKESR